jgi:hypothetical protein
MKKEKAKKVYKDFYGFSNKSEYEIDLASMKNLTQLGRVTEIVYKAKKHNDRKFYNYKHVFKKCPVLLFNGKELIIYGKFKVTEKGIEG